MTMEPSDDKNYRYSLDGFEPEDNDAVVMSEEVFDLTKVDI